MKYDASEPVDPREFNALSEPERLRAIEAHHLPPPEGHPPIDNTRVHAALHAVVESQVASGSPAEARRALDRLLAEGVARHEAIHALGAVASEFVLLVLARGQKFDPEAYARGLRALSAQAVRKEMAKRSQAHDDEEG